MTPLLCRIFGHTWAGIITGFRNTDGAAIGRCRRCLVPVVDPSNRASGPLLADVLALERRETMEPGLMQAVVIRRVLRKTRVRYDDDRFD